MSKWISVKERLPETEKPVLLDCQEYTDHYQCIGFYIPERFLVEDDSSWDMDMLEYDPETDLFIVPSGFYECIHNWPDYTSVAVLDTVTHWMELPKLPKEEK